MTKDKKEKKPKKHFAKKISGMNTSSNITYGTVDVNPKDKKVKFIFGGVIFSLLAVGIGVPLGIGGTEYIIKKPFDPNTPVFEGGETVGGITESNKNKTKIQADLEKIENIIIEKLYTEERDAFLVFEAFINNTKYKGTNNKVGPTSFGFDVSKPYADIQQEQENILENAKRQIRESNPIDWPTKWLETLQSEKYGFSNTEKEAIDFLTKTATREVAFARFNTAEINTSSWTEFDLSLQAKENIIYKDDKGVNQTILAGTKLFSSGINPFLKDGGNNVAIPSDKSAITPSNEVKIAVYQTKSYVLDQRNPLNRLPDLYKNYFKSANISSFSIPFVQSTNNSELELTVTPDLLSKLFSAKRTVAGNLIIPFNNISNFKGASTASTNTNKEIDETILDIFSVTPPTSPDQNPTTRAAETTGSLLGSSKLTSLATLIKSEENTNRAFNIAAISASLNPSPTEGLFKIKVNNPIYNFLSSILSAKTNPNIEIPANGSISGLIDFLLLYWKQVNNVFVFQEGPNFNLFQFNKLLLEKINNIPQADFNNVFNKLFNDTLIDANPYAGFTNPPTLDPNNTTPKKWTVYQIGNGGTPSITNDDTYLYIDSSGLKIYNIEMLHSSADNSIALEMSKSDIQRTIDVITNPSQVILYDIAKQYNSVTTPDMIYKILIEENTTYILDNLVASGIVVADARKMITDVYNYSINIINNTINPDIDSAMKDLSLYVEELVKPMNSYDFYQTIPQNNQPIYTNFMNNSGYTNGSLDGQLLIESQFNDKLYSIITIQVQSKPLFPAKIGGK